jgi:hypothetical protein
MDKANADIIVVILSLLLRNDTSSFNFSKFPLRHSTRSREFGSRHDDLLITATQNKG